MADTQQSPTPIITIDGMPASGKTEIITALRNKCLKNETSFRIIEIPDRTDSQLFKKYYSNPRKYAKVFHYSRLDSSIEEMREAREKSEKRQFDLVLMERSLHGNRVSFELDVRMGYIDSKYRAHYDKKFNAALKEVGHPKYYFLLSDFNLQNAIQRAEEIQIDTNHFNVTYFTQYILEQARVFETLPPEFPIIHHFVLNVPTNILYLNDTVMKLQSLAKLKHTED